MAKAHLKNQCTEKSFRSGVSCAGCEPDSAEEPTAHYSERLNRESC